ncbi:RNA-binding protein [Bacillus solimangrovi]|uniref:RNA-binding protein n=1 Tax=Bacillus solimangrovi TaxID=1305675 RepID=A0A1E5LAS1_9BACI|nr:RNA-binding protein [Bacillus solimangrovi]OEH91184.1 RNA-binding protein [Bacillus solimangrovi]
MSIYQHFRQEEYSFIDQVLEWRDQVIGQYSVKLTDFLDPREQHILSTVIGKDEEVLFSLFGGAESVERKRAILYPPYFEPSDDDFEVHMFEIKYPAKFVTISHRQILGAQMSLGLKRGKFGDILTDGEHYQFLVSKDIADYVRFNLDSVGKASIELIEKPTSELIIFEEEWEHHVGTVSSLRLDVILAEIYNLSRQKVASFINSGVVKVNFKVVERTDYPCEQNDAFSVRGFGRSKLLEIQGKTKKDKYRITYGKKK